MKNNPPKFFHQFFLWFCRRDIRYHIEGDLIEMFQQNIRERGIPTARRIFILEILKLLRPEIMEIFHTRQKLKLTNMTTHHFRIAIRRLFRHGRSSIASITGITTGLVAIILMLYYIQFETTYDTFHDDHERLFMVERILQNSRVNELYDSNPYPLAGELVTKIPEIEKAFNLATTNGFFEFKGNFFKKNYGLYADQEFTNSFKFNFLEGDSKTALNEPMSIAISKTLSKKIDPYGDVMGEKIRIDNKYDFIITGVFEDYHKNSHLSMDYLLSFDSYKAMREIDLSNNWEYRSASFAYIKLKESANPVAVDLKIKNFLESYYNKDRGFQEFLSLRPIQDIYLYTGKVRGGIGKRSEITIIYLFYGVVIFTIIITALNYINSTTAQTMSRELELGIRKVMGSSRADLGQQFFAESTVLLLTSLLIALLLSSLLLPVFGDAVDRDLQFVIQKDWSFLLKIITGTFVVGILAGLYPVIYLSKLKISSFLSGLSAFKRKTTLRKFLVVFQLIISIPLIFTAIIVSEQINFLQTKDLGFNKDNLLRASISTGDISEEKIDYIKSKLLENRDISNCSFSKTAPFNSGNVTDVSHQDFPNENFKLRTHYIDFQFLETYEMTIVEGRPFSKAYATDQQNGVIINETARNLFGWESAVGQAFNKGDLKVIGVVKDFNDYTLFKKIRPMALRLRQTSAQKLIVSVRVNGDDHNETRKFVNDLFNEEFPEDLVRFSYLESNFDSGFLASLENVNKMFIFFSILAVLMTGVGLYSLVSLSARMQQKMIAIRKVLGAGIKDLFLIMLKEYLILYVIATSIGLIASYYLSIVAFGVLPYHTNIKPEYLIGSGVIALVVVIISVVHKITTTVRANPVDAISKE